MGIQRAEPARRFAKTDYRNPSEKKIYVCACVCVGKKRVESRLGQLIVQRDRENSNSDEWSWQCAHNLELISI